VNGKASATVARRRRNAPPTAPSLLYLYCVVEAGTAAERLLAGGQVPGLVPGEALFPIEHAGLVAAVSRVPAATFQEEPLNALLADLPRLTPYAVRHEEAVRALVAEAPALVPMAFGTVYLDERRVRGLLRERAAELRELLGRLRGKHEWGLKVFRDAALLLEAADATSPELRQLAAEAAAAGPGRAYLLGKRRERLRATEAARLAAEAIDAIVERLAALSDEAQNDPDAVDLSSRLPLALKAAFLVAVERAEAFRAAAEELRQTYEPRGLNLELSGPWAPYSFVGERRGGV
jgi:hypothetical protein